VRLLCLGDLLLDVIVRLEQPLATGLRADATAVTHTGPGGQAANVAAWAASLGAEARFVGKRGDDEAGRLVASGLAAHGVEVLGPVVEGRNGVVVSLVSPDGDRTMASDRGVAPDLGADELDPAWFEGCDHLHLSG
jgi:ribokinase